MCWLDHGSWKLSTQLFKSALASVVALTTGNRWVHLILQMQSVLRWGWGTAYASATSKSRHDDLAKEWACEEWRVYVVLYSKCCTFVSLPFPERRFHTECELGGSEEVVGATASHGATCDGGCLRSGNFDFLIVLGIFCEVTL